jgi:hypothetical protein
MVIFIGTAVRMTAPPWENIIKMYLKEIGFAEVEWIDHA